MLAVDIYGAASEILSIVSGRDINEFQDHRVLCNSSFFNLYLLILPGTIQIHKIDSLKPINMISYWKELYLSLRSEGAHYSPNDEKIGILMHSAVSLCAEYSKILKNLKEDFR